MRICYQEKAFRQGSLDIIEQANSIITEYQNQGYDLTLRQLYYQFVSRDLMPNTQRSYKRLGGIINDARLAGLIDWYSIVDRTRNRKLRTRWESPAQIVDSCVRSYHVDHWENQPFRPEVWIEKDALIGVITAVCNKYDVPYFACRGYVSQSEQWRSGRRFRSTLSGGQTPVVLHLGDHDPSGIDMTRDNGDRLDLFAEDGVEVRRLALNFDQVQQYGPPPNPTKLTDSRAAGYLEDHGDESWELDALEPSVISALIEDELKSLIDDAGWATTEERQERERDLLRRLVDQAKEDLDFDS
jgi:hypothetical protein